MIKEHLQNLIGIFHKSFWRFHANLTSYLFQIFKPKPNLVNVICERPLSYTVNVLSAESTDERLRTKSQDN